MGSILYLSVIILVVLLHKYLVEKDMAMEAIEKTMIQRQQTYMRNFLIDKKDGMILVGEKENIKLQNEIAGQLFGEKIGTSIAKPCF